MNSRFILYIGIILTLVLGVYAAGSSLQASVIVLGADLPGDVNKDCVVNIFDLAFIGLAYNSVPGDLNWNPGADINPLPLADGTAEGDSIINIFDLASVGLNYGRSC